MEYAPTSGNSMYYNARPDGNEVVHLARARLKEAQESEKDSEEVDK